MVLTPWTLLHQTPRLLLWSFPILSISIMEIVHGLYLFLSLWLETIIILGRDLFQWLFQPKTSSVSLMVLWQNQQWTLLSILHGIDAITWFWAGFSIQCLRRSPPVSSTSNLLRRCRMTSKSNSLNQMDLEFFSCKRPFLFFLRITNLWVHTIPLLKVFGMSWTTLTPCLNVLVELHILFLSIIIENMCFNS